jgi:hypothetical protein
MRRVMGDGLLLSWLLRIKSVLAPLAFRD